VPRTRIARRPVKEKERFFVQLYLKYGAQPEKIAYCEKRACLKKGSGRKILARKSVKAEIQSKTAPVMQEQMRQSVLGDATEIAQRVMQETLIRKVKLAKSLKIEKQVLDGILMEMVLGLDKHFHPKELLDAIKAAYIVAGSLENNSLRLISAPDPGEINRTGVYTSLFNRLAAEETSKKKQKEAKGSSSTKVDEPPSLQPEVFDLIPSAPKPVMPNPMPSTEAAVEDIAREKEAKPARKSAARVVTVEIG
jgi:hypothetical protein